MCKWNFRIVISQFYYSSASFWRTDRCLSPIILGEKWECRGIMPLLFRKIPIRNTWNHHFQLLRPVRVHRTYTYTYTIAYLRKIYIGLSHRVRCKSSSRARWKLNDLRTNARDCLISRVIVAGYSCKILSFIRKRHIGFEQNRNYSGTRRSGWRSRERSLISCNFLEYECTGRFIILLCLCPLIRTVGVLPLIFGYPYDKTSTSRAVHHHRRGRWCACTYTCANTEVYSGKRKFTSQ